MSYEECQKHSGADATNGCRWCAKEAQLDCKHRFVTCNDCGLFFETPFLYLHAQALELGLQWLTTPKHER